jgi:CRISPR-associated protein Csb1
MDLAEQLLVALGPDRQHTAIVVKAQYQPSGGAGWTVMPPTYPADDDGGRGGRRDDERKPLPQYLIADRLVEVEAEVDDEVKKVVMEKVVTIDQEPSQANRVEEALRIARDEGRLALPMLEMRVKTPPFGEIRLTSLDVPHRYADAYWRDSLVGGIPFDKSELGQRLRTATARDVRPLYEREPCSLIFGAWDSHRKGRWPKFARLYVAAMYGLDPHKGARMGGRVDPVNLTGSLADPADNGDEDDWFSPVPVKVKKQKLSTVGHGHIRPNSTPGGVTVSGIFRQASITLAGLQRLQFGDASPDAAHLGRATLAALALAGDRLAFGPPSVWLRSGCDLAKYSEVVGLERPGGAVEKWSITAQAALDAYHELRDRAAVAGLPMDSNTITVEPNTGTRNALIHAVTVGSQADDAGTGAEDEGAE